MQTNDVLEKETRHLRQLAGALEGTAEEIVAGEPLEPDLFRPILRYLEDFLRHDMARRTRWMALPEPAASRLDSARDAALAEIAPLRARLCEVGLGQSAPGDFATGISAFATLLRDWSAAADEIRATQAEAAAFEPFDADGHLWTTLSQQIAALAPAPFGLGAGQTNQLSPKKPFTSKTLLDVTGLESAYGRIKVLNGIDLTVAKGEIVALVGANGAGKTTFLRTLSGVQPMTAGRIRFDGNDIDRLRPDQRVVAGIGQVPEGRQIFGPLTIEDNLQLGGYTRRAAESAGDLERIYGMFPVLYEKRHLPAGTLSGGQQQMLAIGRTLMSKPRLLLLDEPSMGLSPLLVQEVFKVVSALRDQGMTILLVEQNAFSALAIADRGYVLETGTVVLTGTGKELLESDAVRSAYLGL